MIKHKILLSNGTVLTSGTGTTNAIRSVKLTEQVSDQDDLSPGAACAACAEIELWAPGNALQITQGDALTLFRVDSAAGHEEQVGIFLAEKPVKSSANVYKVTAYDRMTLLDKNLSPWLREQQSAFPMSLAALVQAVCDQCGVSLAEDPLETLPQANYPIRAFYADDLTGRQLIQWAAQAACRFARMDSRGNLTFGWYSRAGAAGVIAPSGGKSTALLRLAGSVLRTAGGEVWRFGQKKYGYLEGTLSYEDYRTAPIDKVQIRQSDTDIGVIWPADAQGTNALVIQENLLLTADSAESLSPVARHIFETMQSITYTPLTVSIPADGPLPVPGSILTVLGPYGQQMTVCLMQRTITGQKVTLQATGNARRDSTSAVNRQKLKNLQGKYLELETTIDGLKVKAGDLSDSYSQLSQDMNGLELTVVKDGEVRTSFAADDASVAIKTGLISFESNSIAIDSDNFKLDEHGNVVAAGSFATNNGIDGIGRNETALTSGDLTFYRTDGSGQSKKVVQIYGYGANSALGNILLFGPDAAGNPIQQVQITTDLVGGRLSMRDASGTQTVVLNASGGSGLLTGNLDIQGPVGLGVSQTVSCQNLNCWGSKSRIVQTGFGALKMAAFETPEPSFADTGSAQCDDTGDCLLVPDPRFAETTDQYKALKWLVTPTSPGSCWVEKGDGFAIVHGQPRMTFDWICIGTQAGYADVYAERTAEGPPEAHNPAYDQLNYITDITETNRQRAEALIPSYDYGTLLSDLLEG